MKKLLFTTSLILSALSNFQVSAMDESTQNQLTQTPNSGHHEQAQPQNGSVTTEINPSPLSKNQILRRCELLILTGNSIHRIKKKYPTLSHANILSAARRMLKNKVIEKRLFNKLTLDLESRRITGSIKKRNGYTTEQLSPVKNLPEHKKQVLLGLLNNRSYDFMERTLGYSREKLYKYVHELKKAGLVTSEQTRYLYPGLIREEGETPQQRVANAVRTILAGDDEVSIGLLVEKTGYKEAGARTLMGKAVSEGLLTQEERVLFDSRIKQRAILRQLVDQVKSKAPLSELFQLTGTNTKADLNRFFSSFYIEGLLTSNDTAYLKVEGTVVQRRGRTKEQLLAFLNDCLARNLQFDMLSKVWTAFNEIANQGARSISTKTLGTHYRELVEKGVVPNTLQNYMRVIKESGERINRETRLGNKKGNKGPHTL